MHLFWSSMTCKKWRFNKIAKWSISKFFINICLLSLVATRCSMTLFFLTIFPCAGTHAFLPQMRATAFNGWDQINVPICRRIGKLKKTYISDQSMVHTSKLQCMKGTFIHWSDYTSEFWCMNHPRPMYEGFFIFNFPHYHPTPLSTQPNPIQQQFCCMFRQTNRQNFAKFCF